MPSRTSRNGTRPRRVGSAQDPRAGSPRRAGPGPPRPGRRRCGPPSRSGGGTTYSTCTRRAAASASISSRMGAASMPSAMRSGRDRAPVGPEQLPHRLAALDLVAAESRRGPTAAGARGHRDRPGRRSPPARPDRCGRPVRPGTPGARAARGDAPAGPAPCRSHPVPASPGPRASGTGSSGVARRRSAQADAASRTTAVQAIPSARPRAPSPSARVAFTLTGAPSTSARPSAIRSTIGGQSGLLGHHRAVGVDRHPAGGGGQGHHPGQDLHAVGPAPRRIGVGGVAAEVAETGRPEHGIGDGVGHGVGVAVPLESPGPVPGDGHPAQHQRAVGLDRRTGGRRVPWPIRSDGRPAVLTGRPRPAGPRPGPDPRAGSASGCCGSPATVRTRSAQLLHQPGVVGGLATRPVGAPQDVTATNAWGVWTATRPSRSTVAATRRRPPASGCRRPAPPGWPRRALGLDRRRPRPMRTARRSASGRAASWTTMTAASSGTARQSGPDRVGPGRHRRSPPGRHRDAVGFGRHAGSPVRRHRPGTTRTTPSAPSGPRPPTRPPPASRPVGANCLGPPKRRPDPPATTMAQTDPVRLRAAPR